MNRMLIGIAGLMLMAGCASTKSAATLAPAGPAKADYFEVKKDGQMYVFSDVKTMQTFMKTGETGPTVSEIYGSKVVSFQATGEQNRLAKDYETQHK